LIGEGAHGKIEQAATKTIGFNGDQPSGATCLKFGELKVWLTHCEHREKRRSGNGVRNGVLVRLRLFNGRDHGEVKLGIIGSGKVGSALGIWAARRGAKVGFTSKHDGSARMAEARAGHGSQALEIGALVDVSEVILLTLPFSEIESALAPVRERLAGKILVDVTNPIAKDHRDLTVGHTDSGAERIARAFPMAQVVKAFNATFAEVYAAEKTELNGTKLTIFFAGDEGAAKVRVRELIELLGFDAVDAGPLSNSRFLEPLSLLNIHLGRVLGMGTDIGFSLARG
jgi:predicted dinucleotide-binding enzyme